MIKGRLKTFLIHFGLFLATLGTTTYFGIQFVMGETAPDFMDIGLSDIFNGMRFSVPLLLFLGTHEFGHYFTSRFHKIKSSLPFFIPIPPIPFIAFNIGTMGAVIKIREQVKTRRQYFDIGVSGPIAGFVVALLLLIYGFRTLPPQEYIYEANPSYQEYGLDYEEVIYTQEYMDENNIGLMLKVGDTPLFWFLKNYVANDPDRVPNNFEIFHYPILFAGFIALFITALNLIPVGQLDGGHVLYGLVGPRKHAIIAPIIFFAFLFYGGLGLINPLKGDEYTWIGALVYAGFLWIATSRVIRNKINRLTIILAIFAIQLGLVMLFPKIEGYSGYLLFGLLLGRILGVYHPPVEIDQKLDKKRKIVGWIAIVIFLLCASPAPLDALENTSAPAENVSGP